MLVPLSWLKEYCPTPLGPHAVAEALTQVGMEVEGVASSGPAIEGVTTAKVLSTAHHPNADRLSLCQVTDGSATFSVVCGAPNVAADQVVAFAHIGATLPPEEPGGKPFTIKRSKIRGVESEGMICSERELGISPEAQGIMVLPATQPLGVPITAALGLGDFILNVSVPSNRPDCLGLIGLARELCAATGVPLRRPPDLDPAATAAEDGDAGQSVKVSLMAPAGCPRYGARVVRGVKIGPGPAWMQRYLQASGVRPISNVVDVTNFVMLEMGHPMHAFDARQITGGQLVVRWARAGERLHALDEREYVLETSDVVIADPERVLALGGIIGGEGSGISAATADVVLEAAYFDPIAIRKTARRLKIHTESSHRFERGCDVAAVPLALDRAAALLRAVAGGTPVKGVIDTYPQPRPLATIPLRVTRVNKVLGTNLERFRMEATLKSLGLGTRETMDGNLLYDADQIMVSVPSHRADLIEEVDLIEEIARMHGMSRIPTTPPLVRSEPVAPDPIVALTIKIKQILSSRGFMEAIGLSFSDRQTERSLALANPLTEHEGYLRTSIADSLVRTLGLNMRHQEEGVSLFEVGRSFAKVPPEGSWGDSDVVGGVQDLRLGLLMAGSRGRHWRAKSPAGDFFHAKGLVEAVMAQLGYGVAVVPGEVPVTFDPSFYHPKRVARIVPAAAPGPDVTILGVVGEMAPPLAEGMREGMSAILAEISIEALLALPVREPVFTPFSAFPRASRDLAVVVPIETTFERVGQSIDRAGIQTLECWNLFDVFTGGTLAPTEKSMAIALAFRHADRTLTDAEVDRSVEKILKTLEREVSARLRS